MAKEITSVSYSKGQGLRVYYDGGSIQVPPEKMVKMRQQGHLPELHETHGMPVAEFRERINKTKD